MLLRGLDCSNVGSDWQGGGALTDDRKRRRRMGWMSETWQLRRGDELLGEIITNGADFPWLEGIFVARPGFAEVKALFDEELALLESGADSDIQAWEAIYGRIAATMSLTAPSGPVGEFLLHIRGDEAWFRWIDQPSPEH
jgi:hypothetical protein